MGLHLKFRENPLYESMTPCALVAITFGQRALLYSEIIMLNSRAIGKYKFYSFYIHIHDPTTKKYTDEQAYGNYLRGKICTKYKVPERVRGPTISLFRHISGGIGSKLISPSIFSRSRLFVHS